MNLIIFKNSLPTSQFTQSTSILETGRLNKIDATNYVSWRAKFSVQ